jgi:hypothetical protein
MKYSAQSEESKLGETRPEASDSAADKISKMLDRFNQRLTLDNLRLIERYVKSEIILLIHFHIHGASEQYVAYFQRAHVVSGPEKGIHFREISRLERGQKAMLLLRSQHRSHGGAAQIYASECTSNSNDNTVLVDVVQSVEHPNLVPLASFVRLDLAKRIDSVLPQALFFSAKKGFVLLGCIENREIEFDLGSGGSEANKQQVTGQMIESTPQILDCVPSDGNNASGDGCNSRYLISQLSKLRVFLFNDAIGLGAEEGADLNMKIDDVFFGPFNFYSDERKPFIGSHL